MLPVARKVPEPDFGLGGSPVSAAALVKAPYYKMPQLWNCTARGRKVLKSYVDTAC